MINDEINSNQQPVSIYLINDIKLLESNIEYKLLGLKMRY